MPVHTCLALKLIDLRCNALPSGSVRVLRAALERGLQGFCAALSPCSLPSRARLPLPLSLPLPLPLPLRPPLGSSLPLLSLALLPSYPPFLATSGSA